MQFSHYIKIDYLNIEFSVLQHVYCFALICTFYYKTYNFENTEHKLIKKYIS